MKRHVSMMARESGNAEDDEYTTHLILFLMHMFTGSMDHNVFFSIFISSFPLSSVDRIKLVYIVLF